MKSRMKATVLVVLLALLGLNPSLGGQQPPLEPVELVDRLLGQLDIAIQHTILGRLAADLQDLKTQAHQVLNVLVGRGGPGYDPSFGGPGDGVGLVTYARWLNREVADLDQRYQLITDNILFFIDSSLPHVRASIRTRKEGEARAELHRALAFLLAARGCPQDLPSEGGARTLQRLLGRGP
jgi:hypothetical protein